MYLKRSNNHHMEVASLYVHDCITNLYSLLNQFNQAKGDYTKCLNLLSIQLNSLKGFVLSNDIDHSQSMDDIVICLSFWLDQLFIQENNDSKLILLLETISHIITLNHILFTKFEIKASYIKTDFIKCLNKLLDMIIMVFEQHSKAIHIKQFLKTDLLGKLLAYINYYDKNMIIDEQNPFGLDLLLNNYLLRFVFLKEYNSVIKQRVNINTYKFKHLKYNSNGSADYSTFLNVDINREQQEYKIHQIVNNKLIPIPNSKYSSILMKISDESCFLQFLYHTIDLGGFNAFIKNNDIIKYYMNITVLNNFDTVNIHNLFKENTNKKPALFMDLLQRQSKPQISQTKVYEKQIESSDKTFLKKLLNMQITLLINNRIMLAENELHGLAKTLIEYTFGLMDVFDCNLIAHNNGKLPLLYLIEYCLLPYIRRLYYLNEKYMQFIDWHFFKTNFICLIQTHNYNNIGLVITELFNFWTYIPLETQEQYINDIVLKYWNETFSPESHGFLNNDILFCKFIVFKKIYLSYDKVLEHLLKLQLKYEFYTGNDLLILPHYRYLNLFKYPQLEKLKLFYELYDVNFSKYQIVKHQNKHILNLNKELPSIKHQKKFAGDNKVNDGSINNKAGSLKNDVTSVSFNTISSMRINDDFRSFDTININEASAIGNSFELFDDSIISSEETSNMNDSSYGISDFFSTNEYTSSITSFFSKKLFNSQEDEPLYESIIGDIEKETKELYDDIYFKSLPIFFYRFSYLDDLLLENISMNQDKFMDVSNDVKDLVTKMGSFLNTSMKENEKELIDKLNYSMNNILKIKLQKENDLQLYNNQWKKKDAGVVANSNKLLKMKLPVEFQSDISENAKNSSLFNVAMFMRIFNKTVEEYDEVVKFEDYFAEDSIMIVHDCTR